MSLCNRNTITEIAKNLGRVHRTTKDIQALSTKELEKLAMIRGISKTIFEETD